MCLQIVALGATQILNMSFKLFVFNLSLRPCHCPPAGRRSDPGRGRGSESAWRPLTGTVCLRLWHSGCHWQQSWCQWQTQQAASLSATHWQCQWQRPRGRPGPGPPTRRVRQSLRSPGPHSMGGLPARSLGAAPQALDRRIMIVTKIRSAPAGARAPLAA